MATPSGILGEILTSWITNSISKQFAFVQGGAESSLSQKAQIERAADWYRTENLVLVLGAGASASYGLPDWNTLLQKLLLITLKSESNGQSDGSGGGDSDRTGLLAKTFSKVFEPDNLIAARYLHGHFKRTNPKSTLAFENAVRDALYSEAISAEESDLLKEIRQFCIAPGRSPNLDSIITYNYDDLLEKCLRNIEVEIPFSSIHARGMKPKVNELPIYHVHGFLPEHGGLTAKNKIVLSESEYHEQYRDVYGWSNLIQINKFKDYNCIFIGLSFSDPNLRRLLDISRKERGDEGVHHMCFKRRYDPAYTKERLERLISENKGILSGQELDSNISDEIVKDLIVTMERFEDTDALSFGVGIVWVDSYDEIPKILRKIRSSTSE